MSTDRIPQTDSIREMAQFWDTHDLTDSEDQLVEVTDKIFQREAEVRIHLPFKEAQTINHLAKAKGIDSADLILRLRCPVRCISSKHHRFARHEPDMSL